MSSVRKEFQPEKQPEDASSHAHGHQTLPLRLLRQGVPQELRPEEALIDSQFGCIDVPSTTRDTCAWYRGGSAARDVLVARGSTVTSPGTVLGTFCSTEPFFSLRSISRGIIKGISKGFEMNVEIGERKRAKE